MSFVVTALPWFVRGNTWHLRHHAIYVATTLVLVAITALAAPLYRRWYLHMRRPGSDERPSLPTSSETAR